MAPSTDMKASRMPIILDSVVLADGLPLLKTQAQYACSGDGRFVFVLGDGKVTSDGSIVFPVAAPTNNENEFLPENLGDTESMTFSLDVIDIFLSKRTRITHVGDFFTFGTMHGFDVVDGKTIILTDYHMRYQVLCQRLIRIDTESNTAECAVHRNYAMNLGPSYSNVATAETFRFAASLDHMRGYIYSIHPLSGVPVRNVSSALQRANTFIRLYNVRRPNNEHIKLDFYFVITEKALGAFVDTHRRRHTMQSVIVIDLSSPLIYYQEAKFTSAFSTLFPDLVMQTSEQQVIMHCESLSSNCIAFFCTRRLEWTCTEPFEYPSIEEILIPSNNDRIILYDTVDIAGTSRVIGNGGRMIRITQMQHPLH